jgi:hypothetical protein
MKKLKLFFAAAVPTVALLAGLGLVCWGVAKFSLPAGLIVGGVFLLLLARALTPETKKN